MTLLHVESEMDSLNSFRVDGGVENVKLHITGQITQCELISPSGTNAFILSSLYQPVDLNIAVQCNYTV